MEKLVIGKVLKPQGIKGEIKIQPLTDNIEQYNQLKNVFIGNESFVVEKVAIRQGYVYMTVAGITDCDMVERFRNKYVEKERVSETNEAGEYYLVDMEKCTVIDEKGYEYGRVVSIDEYGAAEVITVHGKRGELIFPNADGVITDIDVSKKIITVDSKRLSEVRV